MVLASRVMVSLFRAIRASDRVSWIIGHSGFWEKFVRLPGHVGWQARVSCGLTAKGP